MTPLEAFLDNLAVPILIAAIGFGGLVWLLIGQNRSSAERARRAESEALSAGGVPTKLPGEVGRDLAEMFSKPARPDPAIEEMIALVLILRPRMTADSNHMAAGRLAEIQKIMRESPGVAARQIVESFAPGRLLRQAWDTAIARNDLALADEFERLHRASTGIAGRGR